MELAQLQKSFGVITSNAAVVLNPSGSLNNGFSIVVPPVTVILDSLIWIAHTDEHSIRTYLINNILESMSGEVATYSEPNIVHEVVAYCTPRVSYNLGPSLLIKRGKLSMRSIAKVRLMGNSPRADMLRCCVANLKLLSAHVTNRCG